MSNLIRLIALAILVWLLLRLVRSWREGRRLRQQEDVRTKRQIGEMVRCAHCGVHLPAGEAVREGEHYYCSIEHRDAAGPGGE